MVESCGSLKVGSVTHEVYANALQGLNRPVRILLLRTAIQLGEKVSQELRVPVLQDGVSYQPHQVELVVHVVHGQEMSPGGLLRGDVVDVCSCDAQSALGCWPAAGAFAAFFDRSEVFRVHDIA